MKFLILVLSVSAVALGRPSHLAPLLKYSDDGSSFSYSYQTPALISHAQPLVQHYIQPAVHTQYVHQVKALPVASSSYVVGPAVTYTYGGAVPTAKKVEPANIQLSTDGFVLDTPEVAQAKAEHLALVAQESARSAGSSDDSENESQVVEAENVEVIAPKVAAPVEQANIQLSADGHVLDTPEVAQAKADHFARFNAEAANAAANPDVEPITNNVVSYRFVQPINVVEPLHYQPVPILKKTYEDADIKVSADGHVLDTPEVAQAKAEHLAKFNEAAAIAAANPDIPEVNNAVTYNVVQPAAQYIQPVHYVQPASYFKHVEVADIKISADGHVLDTPEVAQAKAAHFAQYSADAARAIAAGGDQSDYADTSSAHADAGLVVAKFGKIEDPPANIQVSSDGFVLDTPEVAQAKSEHLAKLAVVGETSDDGSAAVVPSFVAYTSPAVAYTSAPVAYAAPIAVQPKWYGPEADIKVGADGYLVDTPEVQQARAEHLATRSALLASSGSSEWSGASARYAQASGSHYIQDTPEVAAARAAHLEAHAKEAARVSTVKSFNYGQLVYSAPLVRTAGFGYHYSAPLRYLNFRYAPVAHVALTHDGQYLLDTPEVAAAKAEHFAAHARAVHQ